MENPPFLKVMTKVFILLFVLISVLILYVLLAEGAGENFFFISVITLYPFIYAIVGNLLGYYIYKRNKIGMVVISMIILLMIYIPKAMYIASNSWFYSFLELFFFCLRFFITITLSLIVFFLSIYVFIYKGLMKLLVIFFTTWVVWMILFVLYFVYYWTLEISL